MFAKNQTVTLDITIKKARTTSMNDVLLIAEKDDDVLSVEI